MGIWVQVPEMAGRKGEGAESRKRAGGLWVPGTKFLAVREKGPLKEAGELCGKGSGMKFVVQKAGGMGRVIVRE